MRIKRAKSGWAKFFALRARTRVPADFLVERTLNEDEIAQAWISEIERRIEKYDSNESKTIPAAEVFARAHAVTKKKSGSAP